MRMIIRIALLLCGGLTGIVGCDQAIEAQLVANMESAVRTREMLLDKSKITVVTCGTNSPLGVSDSAEACTAVFVNGQFLLFDSGDGAMRSMNKLQLPIADITAMFLTHFHADHFADLGEVIDRSWIMGRRLVLPIYGGEGVEQLVGGLRTAYTLEYQYRTQHHGPELMPPEFTAVAPKSISLDEGGTALVYDQDGVQVRAFRVTHPPIEPALGYKVMFAGKSVVISGDTTANELLQAQSMNADVLVSEVMDMNTVATMERLSEKNGYAFNAQIFHDIQTYHMGVKELGTLAASANVDTLVLTHIVPQIASPQAMQLLFVQPIKKLFKGDVIAAEDGTQIVLDL